MTTLTRARFNAYKEAVRLLRTRDINQIKGSDATIKVFNLANEAVVLIEEIDHTLAALRLLHRHEVRDDIRSNKHEYCACCDVRWPCSTIQLLGDVWKNY